MLTLAASVMALGPSLAQAAPAMLTYEGYLTDASSGTELAVSGTRSMAVQIFGRNSADGSCLLYTEQHPSVSVEDGHFRLLVGQGSSAVFPGGQTALKEIFNNRMAVSGNSCQFDPSRADSVRLLRIALTNPALVLGDVTLTDAPRALQAENALSLDGKMASDFVQPALLPVCAAGEFLSWNGTSFSCAMAPAGGGGSGLQTLNGLTSPAQTFGTPGTAGLTPNWSSSGAMHTLNIPMASTASVSAGLISKAEYDAFTAKLGTTTSFSGDVSGAYNATSVDKIKGTAVSGTAPTGAQFLVYDGTSKYVPVALSGDATMSASGVMTLKSIGSMGTYTKVATDAQGRVVSGTTLAVSDIPNLDWSKIATGKPTTLAGYGVTDAVQNAGGTVSIQSGLDASKGVAAMDGRIYLATDTQKIYRDSGSAWVQIASNSGAGGTVSSVAAGSGLTGGTITTTGTIGLGVELSGLNSLATTGVVKRTGAGTYSAGPLDLTADANGVLPIASGGTNSSMALNNNRLMYSAGGAIKEMGAMSDGQLVVGKASSAPQIVTMSGDATISNAGVVTISPNAVNSAKILDGTIVGADLDFTGVNIGTTGFMMKDSSGKFASFTCGILGQVPTWTLTGFACQTPSVSISEVDPKVGSNAYNYLSKWNGSQLVTSAVFENSGFVGIGNSSPRGKLDVSGGSIVGTAAPNSTATIDFSSGNIQYTTSSCGAFTLNNLKDGGTYMLVVKGTAAATCSFTAYSNSGSGGLGVHMPPNHGATTSGTHTIYNFAVAGSDVYVAWTPGY